MWTTWQHLQKSCAWFVLYYLLQSIQGIIELPPSVQSQKPHMLPLSDQQVDPGVLGFNGSLCCWRIHRLCGWTFSCKWKTKIFTVPCSHYVMKNRMTSFQVLKCHLSLQRVNTWPDGSGHALLAVYEGYVLPALPLSSTGIWDWIWGSVAGFLLCVLVILSTSGCFLVISSMNACREKQQPCFQSVSWTLRTNLITL